MSWKAVNQILGLASINPVFKQQLQQEPLAAIELHGFELTPVELEVFKRFASLPFPQLCEHLVHELAPDGKRL